MLIIEQNATIFIALAVLFGFFMAWGVGANDVANAMGTSVGSKAVTIKQAILIAVVFEFLGAWLAGGEVTATIRGGIVDPDLLDEDPQYLVYGMLAALLAAGIWLLIASWRGWPVSTTHSIVGAIVGFGAVGLGVNAVDWGQVGVIASSWVVSPLLAGTISFALYKSIQHLIFHAEDSFAAAKKYVPMYVFLVGFIVAMVTLTKGLKYVGLDLSFGASMLWSVVLGLGLVGLGFVIEQRAVYYPVFARVNAAVRSRGRNGGGFAQVGGAAAGAAATTSAGRAGEVHASGGGVGTLLRNGTLIHESNGNVERVFGVLMLFTACAMAFAHGSNDVANAVGPLAAIISVVQSHGVIDSAAPVASWVLFLGGAGIVVGLVTFGHKVIATVGTRITELTASRGFAATLAAATTVVLASGTGLPVSTTHTLVGAVLGVGLARGRNAVDYRVLRSVGVSWLITLPAGAGLAIVFFFAFKAIFG
ncbi:MAG: inorganic phosphate transporter [Actinobacteria bacterium]|nr:inorganic phosphate transporter [Actinomycetota bacterium]